MVVLVLFLLLLVVPVASNVNIKFKSRDLGKERITKQVAEMHSHYAAVGYPKGQEIKSGTQKGSGHKPAESMPDLANIAAINEYGSEQQGIPERPFMRQTVKSTKGKIGKLNKSLYKQVLKGKINGVVAVNRLGVFYEGAIKSEIRDGKFVPNSDMTKYAKKSSRPLIDTGQMRNSITSVTRKV